MHMKHSEERRHTVMYRKDLFVCRLERQAAGMILAVGSVLANASVASAQTDPGVRGGAAGAGGPLAGISIQEEKFFNNGQTRFQQTESVSGTIQGTGSGLGPTFNMDSCAGCHAQPAVGGASPVVNPQVGVATKAGATNAVPFFISITGPVREARFKSDGGVHDLYTITGRTERALKSGGSGT
jgi:CxxC motif-containing protein (DUF1111 family)